MGLEASKADGRPLLLVEPDSNRAAQTSTCLSRGSTPRFEVSHAASLSDAVARIAFAFEAVLLEPEVADGAAEALRMLRSRRTDIPIFVLADASGATMWEALRAGAADVVFRGDPPDDLFAARVRDAIERYRARQTRQLEDLVELYPDAALVVGLDGRVRFVNHAAVELFHREREELLGENLGFSIAEGSISEIQVLRPGGDRTAEIRVSKLSWHDEVAFLAICRDVTEPKRVAMQLQASDRMASIGTMAAGVAHEINNPLAAVLANLELVREHLCDPNAPTPIPAAVLDYLADAIAAGERVREIVRDLKMLSRVADDDCVPVDVERVLDWTLRMVANQTRHRARIVKHYGDVPPVLATESRLAQVFLNLVVNAAQSIREGDAEHNEIRVSTSRGPNGAVVVTIADTGCGMTPEVQGRLFTPFFTTKPIGDGTGLGLAICHRIIEGFGGTITFESRPGDGTRFHVSLVQSAAPQPLTPVPFPAVKAGKRRGRVLVIDDDPTVARVVVRVLSADHEVEAETNGARALERLLAGEKFDVIICDLMMPEVTGMDLHEKLARRFPKEAAKMVFLTGGAFTARSHGFLDSVPNERLEKPFEARQLRAFIDGLIQPAAPVVG